MNVSESAASVGNPDTAKQIVNETGDVVQPKLPGSGKLDGVHSFGGADAVDATLGSNVPVDQGQQLALPGPTQVSTGPAGPGGFSATSQSDTTSLATIPGDPLVYADVLRQNAVANWAGCILGKPYGYGESRAARVQLLDAGKANADGSMGSPVVDIGSPPPPTGDNGAAGRSVSFEFLDAVQAGKNGPVVAGVASEVVEQVAPITLLTGQGNGTPIEIDVVGPWVLRTIAGGVPGSAGVYFGPLDPAVASSGEPAVIVKSGGQVQGSLTFQQLLGDSGIDIPGDPLIHVSLGTPPHMIGDASKGPVISDAGTVASAAADLLKVQVLPASSQTGGAQGVDLRVGHMEASSTAPAGGLECQVPMTVTSNPPSGPPGTTFHKTITVYNPSYFGCDLVLLQEKDEATSPDNIPFTLENPSAPGTVSGNTATWDWTPATAPVIKPGGSHAVTIDLAVPSTVTTAGKIIENAALTKASCALANASGSSGLQVPVGANGGGNVGVPVFAGGSTVVTGGPGVPTVAGGSFQVPTITSAAPRVLGQRLPRTGSGPLLPIAGTLAGLAAMGGWFLRRRLLSE